MPVKQTTMLLLFCSSLALTAPAQSVEITQGMMLANSCAGCHGTDGKSPGAIPAIDGKSADYIAESLRGQGLAVVDEMIQLDAHIKEVGTREVIVKVASDLKAVIRVTVVSEDQSIETSEETSQE